MSPRKCFASPIALLCSLFVCLLYTSCGIFDGDAETTSGICSRSAEQVAEGMRAYHETLLPVIKELSGKLSGKQCLNCHQDGGGGQTSIVYGAEDQPSYETALALANFEAAQSSRYVRKVASGHYCEGLCAEYQQKFTDAIKEWAGREASLPKPDCNSDWKTLVTESYMLHIEDFTQTEKEFRFDLRLQGNYAFSIMGKRFGTVGQYAELSWPKLASGDQRTHIDNVIPYIDGGPVANATNFLLLESVIEKLAFDFGGSNWGVGPLSNVKQIIEIPGDGVDHHLTFAIRVKNTTAPPTKVAIQKTCKAMDKFNTLFPTYVTLGCVDCHANNNGPFLNTTSESLRQTLCDEILSAGLINFNDPSTPDNSYLFRVPTEARKRDGDLHNAGTPVLYPAADEQKLRDWILAEKQKQ